MSSRKERIKKKLKEILKCGYIFYTTLHISMIIIGAINLNHCPVEPKIPKFLLTLGVIGLLSKLIAIFRDFLIKYTGVALYLSILATAELACFIIGSFYTFKEYKPEYDPSSGDNYCNKTVYMFSFVYYLVTLAILGFAMVSVGCFVFGIVVVDRLTGKQSSPPQDIETADVNAGSEHLKDEITK